MNRDGRRETVTAIQQHRISAIIRTDDHELASAAMMAAVEGGFHLIEFTLTTPGALRMIEIFSGRGDVLVGAGTVLTREQARDATSAGARFLVSPIVDREVIEEASVLNAAVIPGAYTPTEMETAHRLGADFVKVFPANAGGVSFIEALRGPLPHLSLFPTAGVTPENFLSFLDAGCAGVGFVRSLFDPRDLGQRDFAAIRDRASHIVSLLSAWAPPHNTSR